jgi:hypothetical protein
MEIQQVKKETTKNMLRLQEIILGQHRYQKLLVVLQTSLNIKRRFKYFV